MSQDSDIWKIPKKLKEVTLWVHPEGQVFGYLFVHLQSSRFDGEQQPLEILNNHKRFVVLKRKGPDEIRFYNRASIVRVEHEEERTEALEPGVVVQRCQVQLMDGCLLEGSLMKSLPPDRSRLFDFLNEEDDLFLKLYGRDGQVTLVNKNYIVCVSTVDDG